MTTLEVLNPPMCGKTTIAAAVAVELASRGHDVHPTTTDPAAHLTSTLESQVDHLEVSRIDPQVEIARYRQGILETKGKDRAAPDRESQERTGASHRTGALAGRGTGGSRTVA